MINLHKNIAIIVLTVVIVFLQFSNTVAFGLTSIDTYDGATQREIREESARLGMDIDVFINTYVVSQIPPDNTNMLILYVVIATTLIVLSGSILVPFIINKKHSVSKDVISSYDLTRKNAIIMLARILEVFNKKYARYPTEEEFAIILTKTTDVPLDPRKGEPVPKLDGIFYGYYYDQRHELTLKVSPHFYRLWTFFENGERFVYQSPSQTN